MNPLIESCLIFAARYAHDRKTGAALLVCNAIKSEWESLSNPTRHLLIKESAEATCNHDDWEHLVEFAKENGITP